MAQMSRCSLARSACDCLSWFSTAVLFASTASIGRALAVLGFRQFGAQLELGLLRDGDFAAQRIGGVFALGQESALLVKLGRQLLHAAAEHFRLGGLGHELAFELARCARSSFSDLATAPRASCRAHASAFGGLARQALVQIAGSLCRCSRAGSCNTSIWARSGHQLDALAVDGHRRARSRSGRSWRARPELRQQRARSPARSSLCRRAGSASRCNSSASCFSLASSANRRGLSRQLELEAADAPRFSCRARRAGSWSSPSSARRSFRAVASTSRIRRAADPCRPGFPPSTAASPLPAGAW